MRTSFFLLFWYYGAHVGNPPIEARRSHRLAARTWPFHGQNRGSIPRGITSTKTSIHLMVDAVFVRDSRANSLGDCLQGNRRGCLIICDAGNKLSTTCTETVSFEFPVGSHQYKRKHPFSRMDVFFYRKQMALVSYRCDKRKYVLAIPNAKTIELGLEVVMSVSVRSDSMSLRTTH